jgi:hypothetical protein
LNLSLNEMFGLPILVGALLGSQALTAPQAANSIDAIPGGPPMILLPQGNPMQTEMFAPLSQRLGILTGFERSPGPYRRKLSSTVAIDLSQQPLRQTLDMLCDGDPRYEWRQLRGVIVVRPVDAWNNPSHPLNRRISMFEVENAGLQELALRLAGLLGRPVNPIPATTGSTGRRVTMRSRDISVLDLLNTIADEQHLAWEFSESAPAPSTSLLLQGLDGENFRVGWRTP